MTSEPGQSGSSHSTTARLGHWLGRLHAGEDGAKAAVLNYSSERLRRLTRKLLAGYPGVRRWEETDDVLQRAMIRLYRALDQVQPENVRSFLGLSALQIRRELADLARHYYGPEGPGANHATDDGPGGEPRDVALPRQVADEAPGVTTLEFWAEFHRQAGLLPPEEREVFELLYYHGLPQAEAAALLEVSDRTIKRRWRAARLRLHEALGPQMGNTMGETGLE